MMIDDLLDAATAALGERQRIQEEKREVERRRAFAIESGLRDLLQTMLPHELYAGACIPPMAEYTYSAASSEYWSCTEVHPPDSLTMAPLRVHLRYRKNQGWDIPASYGVFTVATVYVSAWDDEPGWFVHGSDYHGTDDLVEAVSYSLEMYERYRAACEDAAMRTTRDAAAKAAKKAAKAQELTPAETLVQALRDVLMDM